jgi:16S rRNA (cytosine1402-N4)-methyltransferase
MPNNHIPVLLNEVTGFMPAFQGSRIIDCTAGGGGHILGALSKNPGAKILGIDRDQASLEKIRTKLVQKGLEKNVKLSKGNFSDLLSIASASGFKKADAVLLDLGLSSIQLNDPERGFSFQLKGPLDMRYDKSQRLNAQIVVNEYEEPRLAEIFKNYGEEAFSRRIARNVAIQRKVSPIAGTDQLLEIIEKSLPKPVRHKAKDSARRIFQALRIEVNKELESLERALPQAADMLVYGGRLMAISFHSLEDRKVKRFFVEKAKGCVCPKEIPFCVCAKKPEFKILTKKPLTAGSEEIEKNPRSRPAKLRVIEKI